MTSRIDRINLQASRYRKVNPGQAVVSLVAFVPFLLGWLTRKVVLIAWVTISWLWAATVVGWQSAAGDQPDRASHRGP